MDATRGTGRSARLVSTIMMAATGAGFFFIFVLQDLTAGVVRWSDLPAGLVVRYIVAMGLGGGVAGWLLAGLFGRRGLAGWPLAILGGIVATTVSGLLGSAVAFLPDVLADGWDVVDVIPIVYGLAIVPLTFAARPTLFFVWLALIVATHLWARHARARKAVW